jgi:hypothetical protein
MKLTTWISEKRRRGSSPTRPFLVFLLIAMYLFTLILVTNWSTDVPTWIDYAAKLTACFAFPGIAYQLWVIGKDGEYNRSMKIVEMLEQPSMREARAFVTYNWNNRPVNELSEDERRSLHLFTNTMDIIGSYYLRSFFDKVHFTMLYGRLVWNSYELCKDHIYSERSRRAFPRYQEHFEMMAFDLHRMEEVASNSAVKINSPTSNGME